MEKGKKLEEQKAHYIRSILFRKFDADQSCGYTLFHFEPELRLRRNPQPYDCYLPFINVALLILLEHIERTRCSLLHLVVSPIWSCDNGDALLRDLSEQQVSISSLRAAHPFRNDISSLSVVLVHTVSIAQNQN